MSSIAQPVVVYPNTISTQQPSSHSKGSFSTVFIVLAVIVVVSAIACFLGQLCNRRFSQTKARREHSFHPKESDLEYGFKKRIPTAKLAGNRETKESKAEHVETRKETKFADNGEAKPGR